MPGSGCAGAATVSEAGVGPSELRASGILLAGVEDGEHFDDVGHPIDENVVGMDDRLARAGDAAGAMDQGMIGEALCGGPDRVADALGGDRVTQFDEIDNRFEILQRLRVPDQRDHQPFLRRSMMACIRAMTSSCGMPGALDARRDSILARNHAS